MEQKEITKTRLIIYVLMAYGLTCLMGILMWYGSTKGYDLTVFPTAQMMYPAAGVIIGLFLAHKGEKILPAGFFITVLATTGVLIVLALLSVFLPVNDLNIAGMTMSVYNLISQYVLIIGSIVALVFLAVAGNEKRAAVGLTRQNWKSAVLIVLVFVGIYNVYPMLKQVNPKLTTAMKSTILIGLALLSSGFPFGFLCNQRVTGLRFTSVVAKRVPLALCNPLLKD